MATSRSRYLAALALAAAACGGIAILDGDAGGGGGRASGGASSSSASGGPGGGVVAPDVCAVCDAAKPQALGKLANMAIDEASGVAASRLHEGILYLHNDSGDTARFFASDQSGSDWGSYDFAATARDIEDMAVGTCLGGDGSCIYLADIGDNDETYASYDIYRIAEPSSVTVGAHMVKVESMSFSYPDGSHNAETLLVADDRLYLVTKVSSGPSGIYRLPWSTGSGGVAEKVGEVDVPGTLSLITGGDAGPYGILLRTYSNLFFFPAQSDVPSTFAATPCSLPVAIEMQGEAVTWLGDGIRYATVSEGAAAAVNVTTCL